MKLWIDADACPNAIRQLIINTARRLKVPTTFVANATLHIPKDALFTFHLVEAGPDVADAYIAENARAGDLIVTQDIPLAALLVPMGALVLTPHGRVLDAANIANRLATRDILQGIRDAGQHTGGPAPFDKKDVERFANALDKWLTHAKKTAERKALKRRLAGGEADTAN